MKRVTSQAIGKSCKWLFLQIPSCAFGRSYFGMLCCSTTRHDDWQSAVGCWGLELSLLPCQLLQATLSWRTMISFQICTFACLALPGQLFLLPLKHGPSIMIRLKQFGRYLCVIGERNFRKEFDERKELQAIFFLTINAHDGVFKDNIWGVVTLDQPKLFSCIASGVDSCYCVDYFQMISCDLCWRGRKKHY